MVIIFSSYTAHFSFVKSTNYYEVGEKAALLPCLHLFCTCLPFLLRTISGSVSILCAIEGRMEMVL